MGRKTSPIGFRLQVNKNWKSKWIANKAVFGDLLLEDRLIRQHIRKKPCALGLSSIEIKRMSEKMEVTLYTARPGLVIGKKGAEIEALKMDLSKMTGKNVWVEVSEIKRPDLDAQLVADSIAKQLERRVSFRKVLKKSMQASLDAGADGIRIQVSGRIGGAEIARTEWYIEGQVPLHELRADIQYATARSETTYGTLGVKVWINLGKQYKQDNKKHAVN